MGSSGIILALDVGGRRIGIAIASSVARLAAPHGFIDRDKTPDAFSEVIRLADELQAGTIVVGLPRSLNGQETDQTAITRSFASELAGKTDLPVVMQDEAGTSVMAEERLHDRGKPYGKGDIDAEAAVIILEDYLNQTARSLS